MMDRARCSERRNRYRRRSWDAKKNEEFRSHDLTPQDRWIAGSSMHPARASVAARPSP